jgi:hypothetical protein
MQAPLPNEMSRRVDMYLSAGGDTQLSFGRTWDPGSRSQTDNAPALTIVVKVVFWDGDRQLMPIAHLGTLRREVLVYDTDAIRVRRSGAQPLGRAPAPPVIAANLDTSKRLLQSVANPSSHSLEDYVLSGKLFKQTLRKCTQRHQRDQLSFFIMGKEIFRDDAAAPQTVGGVLRELGHPVDWSEVTLDLALNEAAEQHLCRLCYHPSSTIAIQIEGIELTSPACDDAPFGLPPSTYVSVQHGPTIRYSHIEHNSLTPVFQWTTGGIPYIPGEAIKVCVHMAETRKVKPRIDKVVGRMWIDAPALPLPKSILYPELLTMSLGASVGIIHLSIKGPSLRRKIVPGCVCVCCCGVIPICGSPPCLPSCGNCTARGAASCLRVLRSENCETFTKVACCCCLALGLTFLLSKTPQGEAVTGAVTNGLGSLQKIPSEGLATVARVGTRILN